MTRTRAAALAAAVALTSAPAVQAAPITHTVVPTHTAVGPIGATCGMTAVPDLTPGGAGFMDAELHAGPIVLVTFGDPTALYSGSIRCTVQTGAANATHAGADAGAPVTGPHSSAVAVAAGTTSYRAADRVWLCTAVALDGWGTLHWDAVYETWSLHADAACARATGA